MTALVSLALGEACYPSTAPYDPSEAYPEYPFARSRVANERNTAYTGVRHALELLGLDRERFGTPEWNPLGEVVRRGTTVVVKPNWVYHELPGDERPEEILVTHPAIIRAVLDYVYIACGREGRILLGDAPVQGAHFETIYEMSRVETITNRFRDDLACEIEVADLRAEIAEVSAAGRVRQVPSERPDPAGYRVVDIGHRSFLEDVSERADRFRCLDYDPSALRENHAPGKHRYLLSGSVLEADAVVNVPKLKVHGKAGVTGCLKNLVGINGDKAYLPHFRTGSPRFGGDDYPFPSAIKWSRTAVRERLVHADNETMWRAVRWLGRRALRLASQLRRAEQVGGANPYGIFSGHWYGNDTTWRMVLDLNMALFHARADGTWADDAQRSYISIVDAIVAGERNGPLTPSRREVGGVFATRHPVAGDHAAAWLMGFDPRRIPLLEAARCKLGVAFPDLDSGAVVELATDDGVRVLTNVTTNWRFRAPDGWVGHIERVDESGRSAA